jgi:hypothetical protein
MSYFGIVCSFSTFQTDRSVCLKFSFDAKPTVICLCEDTDNVLSRIEGNRVKIDRQLNTSELFSNFPNALIHSIC